MTDMTYVTRTKCTVRAGTSLYTRIVARIDEGVEVRSSHQVKGWAYIDGLKGWISMLRLEPKKTKNKKS